jgi:hypothetical protein
VVGRWDVYSVIVSCILFYGAICIFMSLIAGGMYIDICGVFGLSQTSFFHPLRGPLWPTVFALDVALANMVVFDTDLEACQKAAIDFAYFSRNMLQHCVCAVDGRNKLCLIAIIILVAVLLLFITLS